VAEAAKAEVAAAEAAANRAAAAAAAAAVVSKTLAVAWRVLMHHVYRVPPVSDLPEQPPEGGEGASLRTRRGRWRWCGRLCILVQLWRRQSQHPWVQLTIRR
jgi:hypothetical protein